jgi:predicted Rossmann fold flavoprotein
MSNVLIVGGGAAGMMAAIVAAKNAHHVVLIEKNEKLGKKIYITGKGRCNVTNACETEDLFKNVIRNPKFLYSAFYGFDNKALMDFFEQAGCELKVERGDRVFPCSDHSSDIIRALLEQLKKYNVEILYKSVVKELILSEKNAKGVLLENGQKLYGDKIIVATGGLTYQTTGSTGDGYRFAKFCGHKIEDTFPSLVPLETKENWARDLQGLSLKNIRATLTMNEKIIFEEFGEMLFTHFGISGPLILSASSFYADKDKKNLFMIYIDLKPALSEEQLDKRVLRDFEENNNKQFKNAIAKLFPTKLIPVMIALSGIHPDKKVNEISKEERKYLIQLIKKLPMTVTGSRDYNEAIITKGGINIKDINPSTMESKLIHNLYFAGEVLDIDALTGGFNLQIAFSTGYLAGENM